MMMRRRRRTTTVFFYIFFHVPESRATGATLAFQNFVTGLLGWHISETLFVTGFLVSGRTSSMSGNIVKTPKSKAAANKVRSGRTCTDQE